MGRQYSSSLMGSIHETAEGLHAAGVMDKRTMREFDELCLTPVRPLEPREIPAMEAPAILGIPLTAAPEGVAERSGMPAT